MKSKRLKIFYFTLDLHFSESTDNIMKLIRDKNKKSESPRANKVIWKIDLNYPDKGKQIKFSQCAKQTLNSI